MHLIFWHVNERHDIIFWYGSSASTTARGGTLAACRRLSLTAFCCWLSVSHYSHPMPAAFTGRFCCWLSCLPWPPPSADGFWMVALLLIVLSPMTPTKCGRLLLVALPVANPPVTPAASLLALLLAVSPMTHPMLTACWWLATHWRAAYNLTQIRQNGVFVFKNPIPNPDRPGKFSESCWEISRNKVAMKR